jgi:tetratricopeptide (TPR) repeat protein
MIKRRGKAYFYVGKFDKALADLRRAVELGDIGTLTWIPPARICECNDEAFRRGFLELVDQAVEKNSPPNEARVARINILAELGELERAHDDLRVVMHGDAAHYPRYLTALFALRSDDVRAYGQACREMLGRFAESTAPLETHFTAWACALAPAALDNYEPAIAIARRSVEIAPESKQSLTGLGAILTRAGRGEEAIETLRKAHEAPASENTSTAYIDYFLAIAHSQLGSDEQANDWLRQAEQHAGEERANKDKPPAWNRRLTLEMLRREARALVLKRPSLEPPQSGSDP